MAADKEEAPDSPDVYFEPLVHLPPVEIVTLEENEETLLKIRAKLFRYDSVADPAEWKERGVGDIKILHNTEEGTCRIVMRRDKTLKICANHYVFPHMELKPNCGSDRAWVWNTPADFADEEPKSELLAIRFANAENAQKFREKFEAAKTIVKENEGKKPQSSNGTPVKSADKDAEAVAEKLGEMSVKEKDTAEKNSSEDSKDDSKKETTSNSEESKPTTSETSKESTSQQNSATSAEKDTEADR